MQRGSRRRLATAVPGVAASVGLVGMPSSNIAADRVALPVTCRLPWLHLKPVARRQRRRLACKHRWGCEAAGRRKCCS